MLRKNLIRAGIKKNHEADKITAYCQVIIDGDAADRNMPLDIDVTGPPSKWQGIALANNGKFTRVYNYPQIDTQDCSLGKDDKVTSTVSSQATVARLFARHGARQTTVFVFFCAWRLHDYTKFTEDFVARDAVPFNAVEDPPNARGGPWQFGVVPISLLVHDHKCCRVEI